MHLSKDEIREEYELVKAAQKEPKAFGLLYERYYKRIYLFIFKRVEHNDLSADLAAQVFYKAMLKLESYEFKGLPFGAWLFRIAVNEVNEFFRKSKRNRIVSIDKENFMELMNETDAPSLLKEIDPHRLIVRLLHELSDDEVYLLELRYFEELSFKEISFILDITENNAKVKSFRIIEKLRKVVEKNELG